VPDELVTLEEAKQHLRIVAEGFDDEVATTLQAAREYCETHSARTLRPETTRTLSLSEWWTGQLAFPWPPLLGVTSVKYYLDDVDETLDAENYQVVLSDEGLGWIEWTEDAEQPDFDTRPDAVRIEYTAGYEELPAKAKHAILLMLTYLWGDGKGRDLEYADRAATKLLYSCNWGDYA
jgi:uncharacterized phiE125 gp8 family phage protein